MFAEMYFVTYTKFFSNQMDSFTYLINRMDIFTLDARALRRHGGLQNTESPWLKER